MSPYIKQLFVLAFDYNLGLYIQYSVLPILSSLNFYPYIDYIVVKATCVLGCIKRHSTNFDSSGFFLNNTLFCVVLEFGTICVHHKPLLIYSSLYRSKTIFSVLSVIDCIFLISILLLFTHSIFLICIQYVFINESLVFYNLNFLKC